ncbi:SMI1/KNR4 family protein [Flagellimonas sp. S174]|uniref:SMI1/KNR4 family protein n=1 Tax=Flagellimonas sp. S174 TaxID=3410790 RepID=UPI003BF4B75D
MAFPVEEKYIAATESDLGVSFPNSFRKRMLKSNGGELVSKKLEFELFPFFDKSSRKRISRTCNHIVLETKNAREWDGFPQNAIAIGSDGSGNLIVLLHTGDGILSDDIHFWNHEKRQSKKIADSIDIIEETIDVRPKASLNQITREKVNSINFQNLIIDLIPAPWKLYKIGENYEFQLGKNSDIKINLLKNPKPNDWNERDFWTKQWASITKLKVKSNMEVTLDEFKNLHIVTCKTKEWTPVLTWVGKKEDSSWVLMFRTELRRLKGDINELKKLLEKIK